MTSSGYWVISRMGSEDLLADGLGLPSESFLFQSLQDWRGKFVFDFKVMPVKDDWQVAFSIVDSGPVGYGFLEVPIEGRVSRLLTVN